LYLSECKEDFVRVVRPLTIDRFEPTTDQGIVLDRQFVAFVMPLSRIFLAHAVIKKRRFVLGRKNDGVFGYRCDTTWDFRTGLAGWKVSLPASFRFLDDGQAYTSTPTFFQIPFVVVSVDLAVFAAWKFGMTDLQCHPVD
jgi:hypothetical protein